MKIRPSKHDAMRRAIGDLGDLFKELKLNDVEITAVLMSFTAGVLLNTDATDDVLAMMRNSLQSYDEVMDAQLN